MYYTLVILEFTGIILTIWIGIRPHPITLVILVLSDIFVAMSFKESLHNAWERGIKPGVLAAARQWSSPLNEKERLTERPLDSCRSPRSSVHACGSSVSTSTTR